MELASSQHNKWIKNFWRLENSLLHPKPYNST